MDQLQPQASPGPNDVKEDNDMRAVDRQNDTEIDSSLPDQMPDEDLTGGA